MKISFFLCFVFTLHLSAKVDSQNKVSIKTTNATLAEVFEQIKSQTGLEIVYSNAELDDFQKVSVAFEDQSVEEILEALLEGTNLVVKQVDEYLVIKPAEKSLITGQQQKMTVQGVVTDQKGQPIPGVNIILKEYNNGTITDGNGFYVLSVPDGQGTLVFSFIGFEKQEVAVNGREQINIMLKEEVSTIGDVVVTGYYQQTKESFTGAAITITADELLRAGNQNVLAAIQLSDPSFMQLENEMAGSNPNVMPEFNIRGSATVDMGDGEEDDDEGRGNPNLPTFILDGFEVKAEKIWDMDPYRVESITILKDAAATAIYGSRAANGVVVINTKAPQKGKMNVSYNADFSFAFADLSDYDLLNGPEKLQLEIDAGYFDYNETEHMSNVEQKLFSYNEKLKMVEQGYNTYWLDKPLNSATFSHKHSLFLEGGNEEFRYGVDVNYNDHNGIMKGSGRDRMGIGMKLQYTYKNLIFKNHMTFDNVKATNSPYGKFSTYAQMNPYYRHQDDNGNELFLLDPYYAIYNPLFDAGLNIIDENGYDNFVNNFGIDWNISADLRLKGSVSIDKKTSKEDEFIPGTHTDYALEKKLEKKGHYEAYRAEEFKWETNLVMSYFKQLDKHVINANAIFNAKEETYKGVGFKAEGFPNDDMAAPSFAIQYEESAKPTEKETTSRLMGLSGSVNYSYDNRYMVDVSFRGDGSSAFGSDKRWAPFWSTGLGWNLHHENFLKESYIVNQLKIRGSYGFTGSVDFDPYQAMMMYKYNTDLTQRYATGANLMGMGNDRLSWQRTLKSNLGMDFAFVDNRITGYVNFYRELSQDMLVDVTLPPSLGFAQYSENLGEVENKGYELYLKWELVRRPENQLSVSVFGSAVHNANKLLNISDYLNSYNEGQDDAVTDPEDGQEHLATQPRVRYIEGESTNAIWANRSLGIDPATGREIFLTKDGGTTVHWSPDNYMVCGDEDPDLYGTFGSFASFKGIQMNVFFKYRLGGEYYNHTLVNRVENADKHYNTDRRVLDDRWKEPGDMTFYKDVENEEYTQPTSRFIQTYNYLELARVNIAYEFNRQLAKKLGLSRLQMNVNMNDIFRTSTVKAERGTNYPFERSFSVGLKAGF